jgi:DNA-binding NarL/FixJ family response regulator
VTPKTILVADDHEIVRRGLVQILALQPELEIVAEAANGAAAVAEAQRLKPDVVVMDIMMPELNGLEATRQITKKLRNTRVLILSMYHSEHLIREVLVSGARGYVLKSDAGRDLLAGVLAVSEGRTFFAPKVAEVVMSGFVAKSQPREIGSESLENGRLTPRERQIVQLLAEGNTNREIAARLSIGLSTVETHRGHIMQKLNLDSISDLVRYAIRNEIVDC